ncbi:MAG: DUF1934 domain-containing protein [Lachnospiraceae bacterium]|nr:DUF1934 domain-containing protein [Lachnospiraceae bacterium]
MNKDVILSMHGLQFEIMDSDGNAADVEVITPAKYYRRGKSHFLLYDEEDEEGNTTGNIIRIKDKLIEVTKRGEINAHMIFEEKKKNLTDYSTPFGNVMIGVETSKVLVDEQENRISVRVDYGLDINYEHLSNCSFRMEIAPRGKTAQ